jgi:hypothetical protein
MVTKEDILLFFKTSTPIGHPTFWAGVSDNSFFFSGHKNLNIEDILSVQKTMIGNLEYIMVIYIDHWQQASRQANIPTYLFKDIIRDRKIREVLN